MELRRGLGIGLDIGLRIRLGNGYGAWHVIRMGLGMGCA